MIALRDFKRKNPGERLVLFFANDLRKKELAVFDLSFADEVHPRAAIPDIPVDRFLQFQVFDPELKADVLDRLPAAVLAKIDRTRNLKPWTQIRRIWRESPDDCDIGLSDVGRCRLPACVAQNRVPPRVFENKLTIAFLWRHRRPGGPVSDRGQVAAADLIRMRSELFQRVIAELDCHVLICGMGVITTDENRERTDNKYTRLALELPAQNSTYLQGLSWGLELEIIRRCSLCIVMGSGFSEALWLKRRGKGVVLVDPPRQYVAKLLWNRMPLFHIMRPGELFFQLRQPHTADRVLRYVTKRRLLSVAPVLAMTPRAGGNISAHSTLRDAGPPGRRPRP
jgi:hypothetical protein